MANMRRKIAHITCCNYSLNRRLLCIKRSWDEVASILQHARCHKCGSKICKK